MIATGRRNRADLQLHAWSQAVVAEARSAVNLTVGLMSGSRMAIDRRAVDRLAIAATSQSEQSTLLIRLTVCGMRAYRPNLADSEEIEDRPVPKRSPLGRWSEVAAEIPLGGSAPRSLELLPKWLAAWKREYRLILIDLGPMHQVPSRTVGRYCDACYLVLGPYSCASHAWIMQQIALLSRCDVALVGSIIAESHDSMAA